MKFDLIFNLDEVGMSEWEYRKEKKMIVPMTMRVRRCITVYEEA
jgi:hypothetical protein